jgi:branched-chain amino acid transport system ATP-binding protein
MNAVLAIDQLTTGYLRAPVLRDLSLTVGDEIVALFGANGAGKTTLLRAIAGTLPAWSGSVSLEGRELGRARPWRRVRLGVAHVPEGRHVFGPMTVSENLEVAGLAGRDARRARDEVLTLFPRLAERCSQQAGSLSGGEQQMLAIGRALMTRPRVLLLDEMSAGLAPIMVHALADGLRAVRERGIAILLVEQAPHVVAELADRVYVLDRGTIVAAGTVAEVGGTDQLAGIYLARS